MLKKRKIVFQYNAPVTLTFAFVALAVMIAGVFTAGISTQKYFCVYRASLLDPLTYFRFFSHVLGHSSWSHYTGNIIYLFLLGPNLEERYGSKRILVCILITALVSGLIQFIFFPGSALLGASGIVFMMIVMSSLGGMKSEGIPLTLIFVLIFYLGQEIYTGIFVDDNISQLTHIIGGICGAVLGILSRKN